MKNDKQSNDSRPAYIISKHKSGAIAIINSACGSEKDEVAQNQNEFYEKAAKLIKPCERSFDTFESYLIEKYDAVNYTPSASEKQIFKSNVILCNFKKVLIETIKIDENSTIEDLIKSREIDKPFEQAKKYPAEKLGLDMQFYKFLIKREAEEEIVKVKIEKTSEYVSVDFDQNHDNRIAMDLITFTGVSEEDINMKTDRFKAYASFLKATGQID